MASPARLTLASRVALSTRHHGPDSPRTRELRAGLAAEQLAEHIERVIAEALPLTAEQRERLALLLHPGARDAT